MGIFPEITLLLNSSLSSFLMGALFAPFFVFTDDENLLNPKREAQGLILLPMLLMFGKVTLFSIVFYFFALFKKKFCMYGGVVMMMRFFDGCCFFNLKKTNKRNKERKKKIFFCFRFLENFFFVY